MAVQDIDGDCYSVPDSVREIVESIDALLARAVASVDDESTVAEINDMLSTGYVRALQCDGQLRRMERRMRALAAEADSPAVERERDALVVARRHMTSEAMFLRAKLEALHASFMRLRQAA